MKEDTHNTPASRSETAPTHRLCRLFVWCRQQSTALGFFLVLGLAAPTLLACQPQRPPQREVFDEAEDAYRRGHYDRALERYEVFLKNNPDHQLAPLAQQRIMSIERELEVVMGRKNGPRPIYLRPVVPGATPESATLQSRSP